jgi:serine/threonine protein kinase
MPSSKPPRPTVARITIEHGADPGACHVLRIGQRFIVGRSSRSAIHLPDSKVSRKHAALTLTPSGLEIMDLKSRNGSKVSGVKLCNGETLVLLAGTTTRLVAGKHELQIEVEADASKGGAADLATITEAFHERGYEVLGVLGRGAMGTVWAAVERATKQRVAIKLLQPNKVRPKQRERFIREGQALAKISSPYVVKVFGCYNDPTGIQYLVLELVNGPSLKELLKRQQLELRDAVKVATDVCYALVAAHAAEVLHRDIKPSNVLISESGTAKLVDFGIAKAASTADVNLTGTSEGMGTIRYSAPEQLASARDATESADLYSFGVLLYELITGAPPYTGPANVVIAQACAEAAAPIQSVSPDCPAELAELVHQLLKPVPAHRPPSAHHVLELLLQLRPSLPRPVRKATGASPAESTVDLD